jgi:hypothetical protein
MNEIQLNPTIRISSSDITNYLGPRLTTNPTRNGFIVFRQNSIIGGKSTSIRARTSNI